MPLPVSDPLDFALGVMRLDATFRQQQAQLSELRQERARQAFMDKQNLAQRQQDTELRLAEFTARQKDRDLVLGQQAEKGLFDFASKGVGFIPAQFAGKVAQAVGSGDSMVPHRAVDVPGVGTLLMRLDDAGQFSAAENEVKKNTLEMELLKENLNAARSRTELSRKRIDAYRNSIPVADMQPITQRLKDFERQVDNRISMAKFFAEQAKERNDHTQAEKHEKEISGWVANRASALGTEEQKVYKQLNELSQAYFDSQSRRAAGQPERDDPAAPTTREDPQLAQDLGVADTLAGNIPDPAAPKPEDTFAPISYSRGRQSYSFLANQRTGVILPLDQESLNEARSNPRWQNNLPRDWATQITRLPDSVPRIFKTRAAEFLNQIKIRQTPVGPPAPTITEPPATTTEPAAEATPNERLTQLNSEMERLVLKHRREQETNDPNMAQTRSELERVVTELKAAGTK